MSAQTRWNWLIDAAVFFSGLVVIATSIYFLVWPVGSQAQSVFGLERAFWEDWHLWGGIAMILAVAIQFVFHWKWGQSKFTNETHHFLASRRCQGICKTR